MRHFQFHNNNCDMSNMYKILAFILVVILVGAFCDTYANVQNFDNASEINDYPKLKSIKFSDICGESLTESQFLLESPNYPEEYPSNINCEITLQGQNCPLQYKFRFLDFEVNNSTGCVNDRLEIDQTDALCGEKNGTETYFAMNGSLKLRFVSDEVNAGRGYKILITRIEECLNETEKFPGSVLTSSGGNGNFNPNFIKCCSVVPESAKHFFIKSPNFPTSMSSPNDCLFQIQKASSDVCRLRIRFQFFWFGNSLDCREGYLQIDGKIICGCKRELNLMSPFFENIKTLRFKSEGMVTNSYSGFSAEIFQDDCPKKVELRPTESSRKISRSSIAMNQKLMYFPTSRDVTEVYYFAYPADHIFRKEREDVNYLETENINNFLGNDVYEYNSCLQWNQIQFDNAFAGKEKDLEKCKRKSKIDEDQSCLKFMQKKGFFFSPGYPFFYPGNLNMCYRFLKIPGHCGVKIHFLDFRIGSSLDCSQDHIEIGNSGTLCGMALWNKIVHLDLGRKEYEDLYFITTYPRCAQGFKAIFEQIPCEEISTQRPLSPPITKIWTLPPPTTPKPQIECGRLIRSEFFTMTNEMNSSECTFIIERFSRAVCRITLHFDHLLLDCSTEYLRINGNNYCGNQSGRTVEIDVQSTPINIHFSKLGSPSVGSMFQISGVQDNTNCLEPPSQLTV